MTDRGIDALVATHIMGKKVGFAPKAWEGSDWLSSDTPTEHNVIAIINEEFKPGDWNPPAWIIPHYSTDIAAAWEVVGKMRQRGWVARLGEYDSSGNWNCRFVPLAAGEWVFEIAPTAPMAICLAALRAVGVGV